MSESVHEMFAFACKCSPSLCLLEGFWERGAVRRAQEVVEEVRAECRAAKKHASEAGMGRAAPSQEGGEEEAVVLVACRDERTCLQLEAVARRGPTEVRAAPLLICTWFGLHACARCSVVPIR